MPTALAKSTQHYNPSGQVIDIDNGRLGLHIKNGVIDRFYNCQTHVAYADRASEYWLGVGSKPRQPLSPQFLYQKMEKRSDGAHVSLGVRIGPIDVDQEIYLPAQGNYMEETISLTNREKDPVWAVDIGLQKKIGSVDDVNAKIDSGQMSHAIGIPLPKGFWFTAPGHPLNFMEELVKNLNLKPSEISTAGSEAWCFFGNRQSLVVSKYNPNTIEFSVLRLEKKESDILLRFGGTASWKRYPELERMRRGAKIRLGTTRYQIVPGSWKNAFYAYRAMMEARGFRLRDGYAAPIIWNELYDNRYWWIIGSPGSRSDKVNRYYTLSDMEKEAQKASGIGAEMLYLDPGWEEGWDGSALWDKHRLLEAKEFVQLMQSRYQLSVGVHVPLPGMIEAAAYPESTWTLLANGRIDSICSGSKYFLNEQARRLKNLAHAGIKFMMFDGTDSYIGCLDARHGHPVPYLRENHAQSILWLMQGLHKEYPNVTIELHDPIGGGNIVHFTPFYYLFEKPKSFDEMWAGEFMWHPLSDLRNGLSRWLYYYNLAYSLPFYLHIDLRNDTLGGLSFWWYASTCRHLGIGGTPDDVNLLEAQKRRVRQYLGLKSFFQDGTFYGIDEDTHAHTLLSKKEALILIFNFETAPIQKGMSINSSALGLGNVKSLFLVDAVGSTNAKLDRKGDSYILQAVIPAEGVGLIRLRAGR